MQEDLPILMPAKSKCNQPLHGSKQETDGAANGLDGCAASSVSREAAHDGGVLRPNGDVSPAAIRLVFTKHEYDAIC